MCDLSWLYISKAHINDQIHSSINETNGLNRRLKSFETFYFQATNNNESLRKEQLASDFSLWRFEYLELKFQQEDTVREHKQQLL